MVTPTELSETTAEEPAAATKASALVTATATRAAADTVSCAGESSQRITTNHKDDFDLKFTPCMKYNGSRVQAWTKSIYRPKTAQSHPQAPEFYWFDTQPDTRAQQRFHLGDVPQPSQAVVLRDEHRGRDQGRLARHPQVCYFDKAPVKGQFYRTSVAYCYDVKSDGIGTICTSRSYTGYVRA